MTYATRAELGDFLGRVIEVSEEGKADICLSIVDEAIDGHVAGRAVGEVTKRLTALMAARRLFLNPDGITQEILGDWQASYQASSILSKNERDLLDNAAGAGGTRRRRHHSPRTRSDIWADTSVVS